MKPRPKLLFFLASIQVSIGLCLAGFAAIFLTGLVSLFYFANGLVITFMGAVVNLKAIEASNQ